MKVFLAKFWSVLLALFLKVGTAVIYFFTDYSWGSWIAPLVEVVIFTWILAWMEKVPFLAKGLAEIYAFFITFFKGVEFFLEKIFHIPIKDFLKWLAKKIQKYIYRFIGYKRISSWGRLKQIRSLRPNSHVKLSVARKERMEKKKENIYLSAHERLVQKRKTKKH